MHHDLCERHAGRLSVPRGWTLVDRRVDADVDRASEHRDLAKRAADAWDPSGSVPADPGEDADAGPDRERQAGDGTATGAVVLEPTLFGEWSADDDRHSLAS